MRELLGVEEYLDELLVLVRPDERSEVLPLAAAFGRVLAADVAAAASVPAFDNSAMDGYAVRFAEVAGAPAGLRVGDPVELTGELLTGPALAGGVLQLINEQAPLPEQALKPLRSASLPEQTRPSPPSPGR